MQSLAVGTCDWRKLGGGGTHEKIVGVIWSDFFPMIFLLSIGIRVTPFGAGTRCRKVELVLRSACVFKHVPGVKDG